MHKHTNECFRFRQGYTKTRKYINIIHSCRVPKYMYSRKIKAHNILFLSKKTMEILYNIQNCPLPATIFNGTLLSLNMDFDINYSIHYHIYGQYTCESLCTNIERCKVGEWMINSEALPNKPRASVLNLEYWNTAQTSLLNNSCLYKTYTQSFGTNIDMLSSIQPS